MSAQCLSVSLSLLPLDFEVLMYCWAPAALVLLGNQSIGVAESVAKPVNPHQLPTMRMLLFTNWAIVGLDDIWPQPTSPSRIQGDCLFSSVIEDDVRERFLSWMLNLPGQPRASPLLCSVLRVRLWTWGFWKGDSGTGDHEVPGVRDRGVLTIPLLRLL